MTRLEREMLARIKERLAGLDPAAAEKLAALKSVDIGKQEETQ